MSDLLTIEEAAAKLRKSKRWLQYFLRQHPVDSAGQPLFSQLGRSKVFDETDILRIKLTASAVSCPCGADPGEGQAGLVETSLYSGNHRIRKL